MDEPMFQSTHTSSTIERVKISQIVRDPSFQVRNSIKPTNVKRYADLMKSGVTLVAITLARCDGVLLLIDGWHRLAAMEQVGQSYTDATIIECNRQQAQWMAAKANLTHGVQLRPNEYRNVFKAYVTARQHLKGRGRLKSYREIGVEIGRAYTTIRNWMIEDFPKIAAQMSGTELIGEGGLREIERPNADPARENLRQLTSLFQSSADPVFRGEIIEAVRLALADMEASGGWQEKVPPAF